MEGQTPHPTQGLQGSVFWRDAQADVPSTKRPQAQLAFKNSMVHGILQFTPGIAFCYVLHRCKSQDIRCRESYIHSGSIAAQDPFSTPIVALSMQHSVP